MLCLIDKVKIIGQSGVTARWCKGQSDHRGNEKKGVREGKVAGLFVKNRGSALASCLSHVVRPSRAMTTSTKQT